MRRAPKPLNIGLTRVTPQLYARPPPSTIFNAPGIHCVFIDCGIPFQPQYDPISSIVSFAETHMGQETTVISDGESVECFIIHPQGIPWEYFDMVEYIVQGVCFEPMTEEECAEQLEEIKTQNEHEGEDRDEDEDEWLA